MRTGYSRARVNRGAYSRPVPQQQTAKPQAKPKAKS